MITETLKLAGSALWSHKLRTSLTLLGVMIGTASVISIISVLDGMMASVASLVSGAGSTTVYVTKFGIITSDEEFFKALKRKDITVDDARAIERGCSLVEDVGVQAYDNFKLRAGNKTLYNVNIQGLSANAVKMEDYELTDGRFISDEDEQHRRPVAVIGVELRKKFFPYDNPIGKEIIYRGEKFTVIGLGKEKGSVLGDNQDRYCIIPVTAMMKLTGIHQNVDIACKVKSEAYLDQAMDQIRMVMRARREVKYHDPDNFALLTSEMILSFFNSFTATVRYVAIFIPMISIVVAGIVVMNIMMVSVTERTREIGIRKAIGARRKNILLQFLMESTIMSLMGGLIGLGIGLYLSSVFDEKLSAPFVISGFAVSIGILVPACIGIFFGMFPAWKASKLDPIEALRFE